MSRAVLEPTEPTVAAVRYGWHQRVFSFPVMLAIMLCLLALMTVRNRFDDPDMWWHLKTGEIIFNTHHIPHTDQFSSTAFGTEWIPHEWLSQISIAAAYRNAGFSGLVAWLYIVTCSLYSLQYALCALYSGNAKVSLVGGMVTWIFSTVGLAVRPQLLGYSLLSLELLIIYCGVTRNRKWLLLLPPLFAIWINVHGSFFFGILVAGAIFFTSLFSFTAGPLIAPPWNPQTRLWLAGIIAASIAALFANPTGFKQVWYPIDTLFHQNLGVGFVDEWQPLNFSDNRAWVLIAVYAAIGLLLIYRVAPIYFHELILLAVAFYLAASHIRMLFLVAIIAAPVLSRMLSGTWDSWSLTTDRWRPNAVMIAAAIAIMVYSFPTRSELNDSVRNNNPDRAISYIRAHNLSGRMFNEYALGGYFIWAMPERKVFIDGRSDLYEWTGVWKDFARLMKLDENPQAILDRYQVTYCVLRKGSYLVNVLPYAGFRQVYQDDVVALFTRNSPDAPPTLAEGAPVGR